LSSCKKSPDAEKGEESAEKKEGSHFWQKKDAEKGEESAEKKEGSHFWQKKSAKAPSAAYKTPAEVVKTVNVAGMWTGEEDQHCAPISLRTLIRTMGCVGSKPELAPLNTSEYNWPQYEGLVPVTVELFLSLPLSLLAKLFKDWDTSDEAVAEWKR
jgi:hypothetical protein